jgi:chromosome segregation ATPase
MDSAAEQDELYRLQTENRYLKETVAALRDEMERNRIGERERLQQALAASHEEIGQLKGAIQALRDELERRKIEYEENGHAREQAAREEAKQLQEMIRAMRDRLEAYEKR